MTTTATPPLQHSQKRGAGRTLQIGVNQPDPRPVTDYTAVYEEVGGGARVTVTLSQPCVIRSPNWSFIDSDSGESVRADHIGFEGNDTIYFTFDSPPPGTINFIEPPYQDTEVQNFQGGFVRPGARWFRTPK